MKKKTKKTKKQTNKNPNKQRQSSSQIHGEFPYFHSQFLHTPQNVGGRGTPL